MRKKVVALFLFFSDGFTHSKGRVFNLTFSLSIPQKPENKFSEIYSKILQKAKARKKNPKKEVNFPLSQALKK